MPRTNIKPVITGIQKIANLAKGNTSLVKTLPLVDRNMALPIALENFYYGGWDGLTNTDRGILGSFDYRLYNNKGNLLLIRPSYTTTEGFTMPITTQGTTVSSDATSNILDLLRLYQYPERPFVRLSEHNLRNLGSYTDLMNFGAMMHLRGFPLIGNGSESMVFDNGDGNVLKLMHNKHDASNLSDVLYQTSLFNAVNFTEPQQVAGYVTDGWGKKVPLVIQRKLQPLFTEAELMNPDPAATEKYTILGSIIELTLGDNGYRTDGFGTWFKEPLDKNTPVLMIGDQHPLNFGITPEGKILSIDGDTGENIVDSWYLKKK